MLDEVEKQSQGLVCSWSGDVARANVIVLVKLNGVLEVEIKCRH